MSITMCPLENSKSKDLFILMYIVGYRKKVFVKLFLYIKYKFLFYFGILQLSHNLVIVNDVDNKEARHFHLFLHHFFKLN